MSNKFSKIKNKQYFVQTEDELVLFKKGMTKQQILKILNDDSKKSGDEFFSSVRNLVAAGIYTTNLFDDDPKIQGVPWLTP